MANGENERPAVEVFVCACGPILEEGVDLDALASAIADNERVARVHRHTMLCSDEGRQFVEEKVKEAPGHRVVFAACSPREHEATFRKVLENAGLNPYLMSMSNIREQCGWVMSSKEDATAKARVMVEASISRVLAQEPLVGREIEALGDALVIGSGIAGLTAAKMLASAGRKVFLVERLPVIGGKVAQLSEVFPNLECASCMVEPLLDDVLHHDNIEVLTLSEVEEAVGFMGSFTVRVRKKARHVSQEGCFGCQSCHAVCPVEVPNDFEAGLSNRKAVYLPYPGNLPNASVVDEASCLYFKDRSCQACVEACPFGNIDLEEKDSVIEIEVGSILIATGIEERISKEGDSAFLFSEVYSPLALERMLNSSGCSNGEIVTREGQRPSTIALVHCADETGHGPSTPCSKICCMSMAKYAELLHEKLPNTRILMVEWERCVGGKGFRELTRKLSSIPNIEEIQLGARDTMRILPASNSSLRSRTAPAEESLPKGRGAVISLTREGRPPIETAVDMAILAPPLGGAPTVRNLASQLRLEVDEAGFFKEEHPRLRSFSSRVEGILVAGSAQAPKDVEEAASHGAAAAGAALAAVVPGRKIYIDPARAHIDPDKCGGCRTCPSICPYRAITFNTGTRVAEINDLSCRGCGACVAACPSSAIKARHFTDEQIRAEIEALVG